jgi:hypothetical protein
MPVTINGSAGVTTNSGAVYNSIQSDTAKTASGTSVDFTGIPSWVKRITVMFQGVSTNGTSELRLQLGTSSGVTTSGYNGISKRFGSSGLTSSANITNGIGVQTANVSASFIFQGVIKVYNLTGNTWVAEVISQGSDDTTCIAVSNVALGAVLDRVRFTTLNGTDTFDAGSINILYE